MQGRQKITTKLLIPIFHLIFRHFAPAVVKMMHLASLFMFMALILPVLASGQTWEQTNGPYGGNIHTLAINSSGDIFAGGIGGEVFRSTDNGDNWTQINNGLTNTDVRALAINSSGDIFAGTHGGGVYRYNS